MTKVYEHPLSPYAQKVKIALREKGVSFDLALPGGLGAGGADGEFLTANPRAEVPVLIDDATAIFDSTIILEYIEDCWPQPPLLPAGAGERARVRMLEEIMDTHYEAINWALGEVGWFRRAEGELAGALRANAARQTRGFHAWLERELGARAWFNGDYFGWGDLAVVPFVAASAGLGNAPESGSKLAAWLDRVLTRPSVAKTVGEARAFDPGAVDVADLVAKGLFKREYRDHRLEWMMKSGGVEVVLKGLEADNNRFTADFSRTEDSEGSMVRDNFVITHAQSTHHIEGMGGGWRDTDLTELGRRQADSIAVRVTELVGGELPNFMLPISNALPKRPRR